MQINFKYIRILVTIRGKTWQAQLGNWQKSEFASAVNVPLGVTYRQTFSQFACQHQHSSFLRSTLVIKRFGEIRRGHCQGIATGRGSAIGPPNVPNSCTIGSSVAGCQVGALHK